MAMVQGTVTVNQATGSYSGTGAAYAVMSVVQPLLLAQLPVGYSLPQLVGISNGAAAIAQAVAALIPYIQSNGVAVAATNSLGSLPGPEGSGIPATDVNLPIV
jgi:hypothetical protein